MGVDAPRVTRRGAGLFPEPSGVCRNLSRAVFRNPDEDLYKAPRTLAVLVSAVPCPRVVLGHMRINPM